MNTEDRVNEIMVRHRHPLADEDGILRDGPCRELFYEQRVNNVECSEEGLTRVFQALNTHLFDGVLPPVVVRVAADFEVGGRYEYDVEGQPDTITLDKTCATAYEWLRDSLVHEMCHHYVRQVLGNKHEDSHGPAWLEIAERLGVAVWYYK